MTNTTDAEEFLAHYGVLGMHWGRHLPGRTEESHNPRPQKRREVHPEHAEAHTLAKQPISSLSTAEIRKVNNRLQAERQYKDLNPDTIKKGKDVYKAIIALGAASVAIVGFTQTPLGKAAINAGKAAIDHILQGEGKHVLREAATVAKHL